MARARLQTAAGWVRTPAVGLRLAALLSAAGAVLGAIFANAAARELPFRPALGGALLAAAAAGGVALGLWWPRRAARAAASARLGRADEARLARALASGSLLGLALAWAALLGVLDALPAWRRLVLWHWLAPDDWATVVIAMLPLAAAALVGALGALALAALHGWNRALLGASRGVVRLWLALLLGAMLGALAYDGFRPLSGWIVLLPLAAGAVIAAASDASAAPEVSPHFRPPAHASRWGLAIAALAAGLLGAATTSLRIGDDAAQGTARAVVLAAAGGILGVGVGRLLVAGRAAGEAASLTAAVTLGAAAIVLLPLPWSLEGGAASGVRLVLAAAAAAVVMRLVGRRLARAAHSIQYALAGVGAAASAAFAAGGLVAAALNASSATATLPSDAGVEQIAFDAQVRELLAGASLRWSVMPAATGPGAAGQARGRGADVVSVGGAELSADGDPPGCVRRALESLVPGGRVVVEFGAGPLPAGCAAVRRALGGHGAPPAWRLEIDRGERRYRALVFGCDVPSWLAQRPLSRDWRVALRACSD